MIYSRTKRLVAQYSPPVLGGVPRMGEGLLSVDFIMQRYKFSPTSTKNN